MTFKTGVAANPGGRPKEYRNLKALARQHTLVALNAIVEACLKGETHSVRAHAGSLLLDRGYGKAGQEINITQDVTPLDALDPTALQSLIALLRQAQIVQGIQEDSTTTH